MSRLLALIEWLRANDPALSRLRLALLVTLTVGLTVGLLMSATYWSRILAGALAGGPAAGSEALRPLAGDALSVLQSIEAKGSAIFSAPHGMPPRKRRHFPLSQRSPILGLDMIVGALARLEPAAPSDGATTALKESSP